MARTMVETASPRIPESKSNWPRRWRRVERVVARSSAVPALILVVVLGTVLSPDFATWNNVRTVLTVASVVGVLAIGEGLVILAGGAGIDLSVGATMAAATIVGARMQSYGVGGVIAGALVTGLFVGLVNGIGVTVAGLEPFIVTLATLTMAQGAGYYLSGASPIGLADAANLPWLNAAVWGVPVTVVVFAVVVLVAQLILSRTVFGRELYIIGGNEEAAHYAGIPVGRRRFVIYLASGFCGGLAALLVIAQLQTASPNFGTTYNLAAIAAVVVGGTPLTGGQGSVFGTTVGVLTISLVSDLLGLLNVGTYIQLMVTGLIVIVVVALNRRGRLRGSRELFRMMPLFVALLIGAIIMFVFLGQVSAV